MSDLQRPLVFFGGKGGVGKTTLATAHALAAADRGQRTMLVSTDPAHSTADLLGVPLSSAPTEAARRLWAVEIDAEADAAAYVERIKDDAARSFPAELIGAISRHLDLAAASPGTVESALFDRVAALMADCPGTYDRIVFDTAPTGHTLRLLALPALLTTWVEGLVRQREKVAGVERMLRNMAGSDDPQADPILGRLRARRELFRTARARLLEDAMFLLVLIPERLPIEETARAERTLAGDGVHVGALVVNRVLPATADGEFLAQRRKQQDAYLAEITERFRGRRIVEIAQQERDVAERAQLLTIAQEMAAGGL